MDAGVRVFISAWATFLWGVVIVISFRMDLFPLLAGAVTLLLVLTLILAANWPGDASGDS